MIDKIKTEGMHQKLNENNRTKQRLLEKAKKVKLKLQVQMTPEKKNTSSWISEKQMKHKVDTDEASQVRQ